MAEPYDINDPEFGKREEDWPDPDVDSDTEEGAAAIERSEAAMLATINRSVARRYQQTNTFAHIPKSLYIKARDHQDQLTADERQVLLGRGDVIGRVLAAPDSLTLEEMHMFLNWPPPDVVRANIQRHTGGQLSTPRELFAKAQDAIAQNQFQTLLSPEEISLMASGFHESSASSEPDSYMLALGPYLRIPGFHEAYKLLKTRLGVVGRVHHRSMMHVMQQMTGGTVEPASGENHGDIYDALETLYRQRDLGTVSGEEFIARQNELGAAMARIFPLSLPSMPPPVPAPGMPVASATRHVPDAPTPFSPDIWQDAPAVKDAPWPHGSMVFTPLRLFREDRRDRPPEESTSQAWHQLTEEQREAYRSRSERLCRKAWDEYERHKAAGTEPSRGFYTEPQRHEREGARSPGESDAAVRPDALCVTGFQLFKDDIGVARGTRASKEESKMARIRWTGLSKAEKEAYTERAAQANKYKRDARGRATLARTQQYMQQEKEYLAWAENGNDGNVTV